MARELARQGRWRRLALYAAAVITVFAASWWLTGSARAALGLAVIAIGVLVAISTRRNDDAAKWRRGAVGERSTARYLRPLERRGYTVLHDRALDRPGDTANIDHLVIGPCGPVVVDSKNWHRHTMVKARRGRVFVGRTKGAKIVAATALERRRVTQGLSADIGAPVTAHAVLAIHGARLPYWRRPEIEGIPLLRARQVRRWITGLPAVHDAATVARLAEAAARRFPAYVAPADPSIRD
ncbi:nuclease-related domain-containing protein [Spirillospora sp. NPDC000708]